MRVRERIRGTRQPWPVHTRVTAHGDPHSHAVTQWGEGEAADVDTAVAGDRDTEGCPADIKTRVAPTGRYQFHPGQGRPDPPLPFVCGFLRNMPALLRVGGEKRGCAAGQDAGPRPGGDPRPRAAAGPPRGRWALGVSSKDRRHRLLGGKAARRPGRSQGLAGTRQSSGPRRCHPPDPSVRPGGAQRSCGAVKEATPGSPGRRANDVGDRCSPIRSFSATRRGGSPQGGVGSHGAEGLRGQVWGPKSLEGEPSPVWRPEIQSLGHEVPWLRLAGALDPSGQGHCLFP